MHTPKPRVFGAAVLDVVSVRRRGEEDVGGGRLIPTTSSDQYAATLARWFGIEDADLQTVAPNLGNFAVQDLGFFV